MLACSMLRTIGLAGGLMAMPWVARADDCEKMMSAMTAVFKRTSASDTTIVVPGKPTGRGRTIYDGTKFYARINGTWQSWPMTSQEMIDGMIETQKSAGSICERVGSEAVGGMATTIFAMHSVTERATSDTRLWISDSSGLPLKAETQFTSGMTVSQVFNYDDIEVPPEAK